MRCRSITTSKRIHISMRDFKRSATSSYSKDVRLTIDTIFLRYNISAMQRVPTFATFNKGRIRCSPSRKQLSMNKVGHELRPPRLLHNLEDSASPLNYLHVLYACDANFNTSNAATVTRKNVSDNGGTKNSSRKGSCTRSSDQEGKRQFSIGTIFSVF